MSQSQKRKVSESSKKRQAPRQADRVEQAPIARMEAPDWLALQRALDDPSMATHAGIMALQETAGNRAVQRLVDQAAAEAVLQRSCGDAVKHASPAVPANCHEWVLTKKGANAQMIQGFRAKGRTAAGASLDNEWYGTNIIQGAVTKVDKESVKGLEPGTILILSPPQRPPHSMILARQSTTETLVRGFNNTGTFGPDAPKDKLDETLRSLHTPAPKIRAVGMTTQWTEDGKKFILAFGGTAEMCAVDDATYRANVQGAPT